MRHLKKEEKEEEHAHAPLPPSSPLPLASSKRLPRTMSAPSHLTRAVRLQGVLKSNREPGD